MQVKTWEVVPAFTIKEMLRNHIEDEVEGMRMAFKDSNTEIMRNCIKDIMQGASTYGHHLSRHYKYELRSIIDKYLDEQTDILLEDDTDWNDISNSLGYLIRLQMLMGALEG